MTRYLISTMPAAGHVHPAIPVAAELVARGHEVVWHTGTEYAEVVTATGAIFEPTRHTRSFTDLPAEPDPGTKGAAEAVSTLRKLLVDRMPGQLADYEDIASRYQIDAVVVDLCALGGHAFAERHAIGWATLGISPFTMPSADTPPFGTGRPPPTGPLGRTRIRMYNWLGGFFLRGLDDAYATRRAEVGLPELSRGEGVFDHMVSPMLHLQASTPAIEYPRRAWPSTVHFAGPLLPASVATSELPPWWDDLLKANVDGRPVVHITQGTVATDPAILTRPAIEALSGLDGLVVVTTLQPDALGTLPANVRVAPYIPHALLLPHVRAMVTNGGFNGAKMALAHGVALVLAPWGNDQPDVAARIAWAGAGIDLRVRTPSPRAIEAAVRRVLTDDSYRLAAVAVAREFQTYPGGQRAADLLEELVRPGGISPR